MKNLLSDSALEQIKDLITLELKKRSIHVDLTISEKTISEGYSEIELVSTEFFTTPTLYKKCIVQNFSTSVSIDEKIGDFVRVCIQVNANFELFSGGTNGLNLFNVDFLVREYSIQLTKLY